ncbi:MAG: transglutaminase family protein [Gammaproteobacteria bacterium]
MADVAARTRAFLSDPAASELDAAILIAAMLDAHLDCDRVRRDCEALVARCRVACEGRAGAEALCRFFAGEGFAGNHADYDSLDNSRIDRVLSERRGIPITLAVLYLEAARGVGLEAVGINFPGHFLVRIAGAVVDPFANQALDDAQCRERLRAAGAAAFVDAGPTEILLRMLNNVKAIALADDGLAQGLDIVRCQRLIRPDEPALAVEEAMLLERLGAPAAAAELVTALASRLPAASEGAQRLGLWLERLRSKARPTLH